MAQNRDPLALGRVEWGCQQYLSGGGQPGNSRTGALFSDAPFCSDCWSGESHCAISEKTSHLDAMDNTGYLADNLSCCVRLRNVFRRVEATYSDRRVNDSQRKRPPCDNHW